MSKIKKLIHIPTIIASKLLPIADKLSPLSLLGLRLWVANIFWESGRLKLQNWDSTLFLFEEEYQVPVLPFELAAYMGTAGEIFGSLMIAFGLGGRVGATILLTMTAVIEFTYEHSDEHIIWALVLTTVLLQGAGKISFDHLFSRKFLPNRHR